MAGDDAADMKRLLLIAATVASLSAALPLGQAAEARERDGDHRGQSHDRRAQPSREDARSDRWRDERRRRDEAGPRDIGPGPPQAAPRRGGYLPDNYRGAFVDDYERYRLRPPPRGFTWVRMGDGFALVGPDGRVFDMVR
jgi:Ni/Co efflux regulator RcnB